MGYGMEVGCDGLALPQSAKETKQARASKKTSGSALGPALLVCLFWFFSDNRQKKPTSPNMFFPTTAKTLKTKKNQAQAKKKDPLEPTPSRPLGGPRAWHAAVRQRHVACGSLEVAPGPVDRLEEGRPICFFAVVYFTTLQTKRETAKETAPIVGGPRPSFGHGPSR